MYVEGEHEGGLVKYLDVHLQWTLVAADKSEPARPAVSPLPPTRRSQPLAAYATISGSRDAHESLPTAVTVAGTIAQSRTVCPNLHVIDRDW